MEALDERLKRLEGRIGRPREGGGAAVRELGALVERYRSTEDKGFEAFVARYAELETFLGTDAALRDVLATQQMKERIVLFAAEDCRRVATQLEAMQELRRGLEREPVPNLPDVQRKLAEVEATALVRMDDGADLARGVEAFLERYGAVVELMNEKFMFYHRKLAEWERLVDRLQ